MTQDVIMMIEQLGGNKAILKKYWMVNKKVST